MAQQFLDQLNVSKQLSEGLNASTESIYPQKIASDLLKEGDETSVNQALDGAMGKALQAAIVKIVQQSSKEENAASGVEMRGEVAEVPNMTNTEISSGEEVGQELESEVANSAQTPASAEQSGDVKRVSVSETPKGVDPRDWAQWLWQLVVKTTAKKKDETQSVDAPTEVAAETRRAENVEEKDSEVAPTAEAVREDRPDLASIEKLIGQNNVEGMTHLNEGLSWSMDSGVWYSHSYDQYSKKQNFKSMPKNYWKGFSNEKYFEMKGFYKFQLRKGQSASKAIEEFFSGLTICECYSAMVAIEYRTMLKVLGAEKFDDLFGSEERETDNPMLIEARPSAKNPLKKFTSRTDAAKGGQSGEFNDRPAKPGEWYYFYNHPKYLLKHPAGAFQGENCFFMGENEDGDQIWRGFGVDAVTEEEMLEEMAHAFNTSRNDYDEEKIKELEEKGVNTSIFDEKNFPGSVSWEDVLSADSFSYGGTTRTGGFLAQAGQKLDAGAVTELLTQLSGQIAEKETPKNEVATTPASQSEVKSSQVVHQTKIRASKTLSEEESVQTLEAVVAKSTKSIPKIVNTQVVETTSIQDANSTTVVNSSETESVQTIENSIETIEVMVANNSSIQDTTSSQTTQGGLKALQTKPPAGVDPLAWEQWLEWQFHLRTMHKEKEEASKTVAPPEATAETDRPEVAESVVEEKQPEPTQEVQVTRADRPDLKSIEKFVGKYNIEGMTHLNEGLSWSMDSGVWYSHTYDRYSKKKNFKSMPQNYWKGYSNEKYFEMRGFYKFQLRQGESASEAIEEFFSGLTICECYSAMMAIEYRTLLKVLGNEKFDEVFGQEGVESENRMLIEARPSAINPLKQFTDRTDAAKSGQSGEFNNRPAKPGEWYYFYNHPKYLLKHPAGAFQGENCFYMGENEDGDQLWRGFGVESVTEEEMLEEMAHAFNSSRNDYDEEKIKELEERGIDTSIFDEDNFPGSISWEEVLSADSFSYGGTTRTGGFLAQAGQELSASAIADLLMKLGIEVGGKKKDKDKDEAVALRSQGRAERPQV